MWCICKTIEFFKGLPESFLDHSVHLDELSYQTKYKKPNPLRQPLLEQIKGARLDEIKHVDHHLGDKKANLRIKIKMTKEEAGRLLGKCRDEKGRLEFRDVALELAKIPPHRILEDTAEHPPCASFVRLPFVGRSSRRDQRQSKIHTRVDQLDESHLRL